MGVSPSLGRHGQGRGVFGQGIYFSSDPALAASYVRPGSCPHGLGQWRCVLICQVTPGPLVSIGGQENKQTSAGEAHDVPDGYIIVEDSKSVVVRAAVFWRNELSGNQGGVLQWMFAALLVAAVAFYQFWTQMPPAVRRRRFGI